MWKHPQGEAFWATVMVAGLILLNIFQYTHLKTVNKRLDAAQSSALALRQEVEGLKSRTLDLENSRSAATPPEPVATVSTVVATAAPDPAMRIRELQQQNDRLQRQFRAELLRLKAATSSTDAKITQVSAEVGTVRSDLAARDMTLKRVMGDLGAQSSLIATNRQELDSLRANGDRFYFDFAVVRAKEPKRVSDVGILLKRTDLKRSRFTIELITSDKRIEKKDRTLNEPIQFYVRKRTGPYEKESDVLYELVVNEIKADQVAGYLSTPRALTR